MQNGVSCIYLYQSNIGPFINLFLVEFNNFTRIYLFRATWDSCIKTVSSKFNLGPIHQCSFCQTLSSQSHVQRQLPGRGQG